MDDRIQGALDGEVAPDRLTAAEREELARTEALLGAVVRAVPVARLPDLGPAVLRRLADPDPEPSRLARGSSARGAMPDRSAWWRGAAAWLVTPRAVTLRWRPAYGLAVAALAALLVVQPRPASRPAVAQVLTTFVLHAPDAREVSLAGDFTGWRPSHALRRSGPGVWTIVVALEPGVHHYAFVVDGERWVADPSAPAVSDGFGGLNSRLAVLAPDEQVSP